MATLVLTAVGTAVGGPIGGAIGSIIGQQIDKVIFAPGTRQGPRLADLALQTSSYGSAIPKLFGTVRVSGTVIWSTDLVETQTRQSNGKGRGATEVYSYSASFAVALSARAIAGIGRIWADGKLLRGAAGDFKTETGFRFYTGGEGQEIDPLIAGREGLDATPAYRGIAYAVFEDMQLGPYGNRIPSLSFEVFADSGPVAAGAVIGELAGVASDGGPLLGGIATSGDSARGLAEALARAVPFALVDQPGGLALQFGKGALRAVATRDRGAGRQAQAPFAIERAAAAELPEALTLAYSDAGRDYLAGVQTARRESSARRAWSIELPAVVDAVRARMLAETRLAQIWAERLRATVTLPWRALVIAPGDRVTIPGLAGEWRVATVALEAMVLRLSLVQSHGAASMAVAADGGRPTPQPDLIHGPTTLHVIDLPPLDDVPLSAPQVAVVAAGASPGWRRAALLASLDGGATYVTAGATALPAVIGASVTAVAAPRSLAIADTGQAFEVALLSAGMQLSDADAAALAAGANRALLGDELIQFARAEPLGGTRWRLSMLLRGRRGTEWASTVHPAGSRFILLEPDALRLLPGALAVPGVQVMAVGVGDPVGVVASGPASVGQALRPLAPVGPVVSPGAADRLVSWVRRSRDGWLWRDAVEVPVAEEREAYRLVKRAAGRDDLVAELSVPRWTYTAAERAADAAAGAVTVTVEVTQLGSFGIGRPATLTIPTA